MDKLEILEKAIKETLKTRLVLNDDYIIDFLYKNIKAETEEKQDEIVAEYSEKIHNSNLFNSVILNDGQGYIFDTTKKAVIEFIKDYAWNLSPDIIEQNFMINGRPQSGWILIQEILDGDF